MNAAAGTNGTDHVTTFLAVWGAILSSVTVGWTLYRDFRDRPKIKVTAKLRVMGRRPVDGAPFVADPHLNLEGAGDQLFIVVSVINIGRRRFRWRGLGGKYLTPVDGRDNFLVSTRSLPKILEEQEALDEVVDLNEQIAGGNIGKLYIWDGAGHEWKVSRKDLKQLRDDLAKYVDLQPHP